MATGHGIYPIKMYAGSVELEFEVSGDNEDGLDTVRPLSGWCAYEKAGANTNKKEFEASGDNEDGLDRVKPLGGWWAYEKAGAKTNKKGCIVNVIENSRSFLD
jgi:hypothetical protein